jgi:hypothetical protein
MASELRVNTLKDASGNNSIATSFVAGGSAKSWSNFNGTDDTIRDSFNVSTLTDRGSGLWTLTVTNSFGNDDYSGSGSAADSYPDADARNRMILNMPNSASEIYINGFTTDGGADSTLVYISSSNHGDLA